MQLIIKGKNIEISEYLRHYVEKKIGKLDRYLPTISEAQVELSVESAKSAADRQVVQVTLKSKGTILRAEERSDDIFASIDAVLDKLYRQIIRYKERLYRHGKGRGQMPPVEEYYEEEPPRYIVRRKRFQISPMSEEEAVEQMELLGHDFFVFYNIDSGGINVLYRRRDGDYGIIEPELA